LPSPVIKRTFGDLIRIVCGIRMEAAQRRELVGYGLRVPTVVGPLSATRLAHGYAELAGIEVGLAKEVLEPKSRGQKTEAGDLRAQNGRFRCNVF